MTNFFPKDTRTFRSVGSPKGATASGRREAKAEESGSGASDAPINLSVFGRNSSFCSNIIVVLLRIIVTNRPKCRDGGGGLELPFKASKT